VKESIQVFFKTADM